MNFECKKYIVWNNLKLLPYIFREQVEVISDSMKFTLLFQNK